MALVRPFVTEDDPLVENDDVTTLLVLRFEDRIELLRLSDEMNEWNVRRSSIIQRFCSPRRDVVRCVLHRKYQMVHDPLEARHRPDRRIRSQSDLYSRAR